jgi:hypothetical protein
MRRNDQSKNEKRIRTAIEEAIQDFVRRGLLVDSDGLKGQNSIKSYGAYRCWQDFYQCWQNFALNSPSCSRYYARKHIGEKAKSQYAAMSIHHCRHLFGFKSAADPTLRNCWISIVEPKNQRDLVDERALSYHRDT